MKTPERRRRSFRSMLPVLGGLTLLLAACGGGGRDHSDLLAMSWLAASAAPASPAGATAPAGATDATYAVGGTVTGLLGTGLVLQNNAGDDLAIAADGSFRFATGLAQGAAYSVRIKSQPRILTRECTLSGGSGSVAAGAVTSVAVVCAAPAARFAYTADEGSNSVSAFSIDAATGALTALPSGPIGTGSQPIHMAVHPKGHAAYVVNSGANTVYQYSIDRATGELSPMSTLSVPVGATPVAVAVEPTGRFAYVVSQALNNVSVYAIDPASGALSFIPGSRVNTGFSPWTIALDPLGRFAYVGNVLGPLGSNTVSAYAIQPDTGLLSPLGMVAAPESPSNLVVDMARNTLVVTGHRADLLSFYDIAADGMIVQASQVSTSPSREPGEVVIDPRGRFGYVVAAATNEVQVYPIDPATGHWGAPRLFTVGNMPTGLAIDPQGRFAYVANRDDATVYAYRLDPATGELRSQTMQSTTLRPSAVVLSR